MDVIDAVVAYREIFVTDEDHPAGLYAFACSVCSRDVREGPCPDHAPTEFPGLRLVDCAAEPRHLLWVHDREDYGMPCFVCMANEQAKRDAEALRCRHWPWRRWKLTRWVCSQLYVSGIATSGGGLHWGDGHDWCQDRLPHLRGKRVYILWVQRETWRCLLKGRHRRREVAAGLCGVCAPWPCCGAQTEEHTPGCAEAFT